MQSQKKQASVSALFEKAAQLEASKRAELKKHGRLSARARLEALFDEQSFTEVGAFSCRSTDKIAESDRIVAGYGAVDGRLVFAFSQDFAQDLGAFCEAGAKKICSLYELALKKGAPIIAFLDSNGASLDEGVSVFSAYGKIIKKAADAKGIIPQIAVVSGVCSGAMSLYAGGLDFIIAEKNNSRLFMNAPAKVKDINQSRADFSKYEDFSKSGIAAIGADGEEAAVYYAKKLLSYLPSNNECGTLSYDPTDDLNRATVCFSNADSTIDFDAASVLADIADGHDVFEVYSDYAPELKCGFMTLGGTAVAFIANDPAFGGKLTNDACKKAARMVDFCNQFDITIINLVNTAGFDAENEAEGEIIPAASNLALEYSLCEAPIITLVTGRAYGSAFMTMASKEFGADMVFALPYSEISLLAPDTSVAFLWDEKFADVKDAVTGRAELIEKWRDDMTSPITAASAGLIDDILNPAEVRQRLISAVYMLTNK